MQNVDEREQRHHEARCAKAALRAVVVDERLLDRMQCAVVFDFCLAIESSRFLSFL
jgi:hypothetical protein